MWLPENKSTAADKPHCPRGHTSCCYSPAPCVRQDPLKQTHLPSCGGRTVVRSHKGQGMTGTAKATWLFKQSEVIDRGDQNKEWGSKQQISTYNVHTAIRRGSPNSFKTGGSADCPGLRHSILSSVRLSIVLCL